jgi:hypothetical protein
MLRWALAIVIVVWVGVVALRAAPAAADPTRSDLKAAIITLDDLEPGFEVSSEGPITDAIDYQVTFLRRRRPVQTVHVQLTVIATSPLGFELHVGAFVDALTTADPDTVLFARQTPAPTLGERTIRYTFTGRVSRTPVGGELLAWEYRGIRALVLALSEDTVRALPYAQRQQQRLEATFGPTPPSMSSAASPTTAPASPPAASSAPVAFPEGAFVQAQDGSEWVVAGGRRLGITWTEDETNVVPELPRGPSVSTAGQLTAALAAAPDASGVDREPPFADGSFVRARDGSRWVVSRGRRYALTFLTDDANVIPSLPKGPSVSTADQLAAELSAPQPAPAPASPAPSAAEETTSAPPASPAAVTPSSPMPSSPPPAEPTALLVAEGVGDAETDYFTAPGRVQLCWEVRGRSPSGTFGPDASFYIYPQGTRGGSYVARFGPKNDNGCTFANIRPGAYYIEVIATSWTRWRITIYSAP